MPSLERVFGHNPRLMKALVQARITSVVSVMLLPWQVLMEFDGIGEKTAKSITGILAKHGLGHHTVNEKIVDFVDQQFGSVEAAPVSVLNVMTLRSFTTRQYYVPLHLILLIQDVNPQYTINQLKQASINDLLEMLENRVHYGPMLEELMEDIPDVKWRLQQWFRGNPASLRSSPHRSRMAPILQ